MIEILVHAFCILATIGILGFPLALFTMTELNHNRRR